MINEQELISKAISDRELSEIIKVIKKNEISEDDKVVDEYEDWFSSDGNSFQTSKTVDNTDYAFEMNSDCEVHVSGKLYDLMADSEKNNYFAFDKKSYPIINIVSRINDKIIIADPDYKRELIWDSRQQSKFIESILLGLPIPPLFFEIDYQGKWLAIDGTQRLMTIKRLFDNNLVLGNLQFLKEMEKCRFDDLPDNYKHRLEDYGIETVVVDLDISEQMKSALFERLNISGANISSQELRNYLYRKTSFLLLRRLRQQIKNKKRIILPSLKKSQLDEFILRLLSFYFVSERKLGRGDLDHLMRLIENEDDERVVLWFSDQCTKIDSAFESKGVWLFDNIVTSSLLKNSIDSDNCLTMKDFLVLFGVACSLSEKKLRKNINQIIRSIADRTTMTNLFGAVNHIMKGLD